MRFCLAWSNDALTLAGEDFLKTTVASSTHTQLAGNRSRAARTQKHVWLSWECPSRVCFLFKCNTNSSSGVTMTERRYKTEMHVLNCSRMWHGSAGATDVVMPVPAEAPCVKGGAALLGSISRIEGLIPAQSLGTLAHSCYTHGLRSPRPDLRTIIYKVRC